MDKVRTEGGGNLGDHSPHCDMGARPALLGSAHRSRVAKTAGGSAIDLRDVIPPASMRSASLSHKRENANCVIYAVCNIIAPEMHSVNSI